MAGSDDGPSAYMQDWAERAAILEFEAGMPRGKAEAEAHRMISERDARLRAAREAADARARAAATAQGAKVKAGDADDRWFAEAKERMRGLTTFGAPSGKG